MPMHVLRRQEAPANPQRDLQQTNQTGSPAFHVGDYVTVPNQLSNDRDPARIRHAITRQH
jgi:hypothetical protein